MGLTDAQAVQAGAVASPKPEPSPSLAHEPPPPADLPPPAAQGAWSQGLSDKVKEAPSLANAANAANAADEHAYQSMGAKVVT